MLPSSCQLCQHCGNQRLLLYNLLCHCDNKVGIIMTLVFQGTPQTAVEPYRPEFMIIHISWNTGKNCIFYLCWTLRWHNQLHYQCISIHGTDLVIPEYSKWMPSAQIIFLWSSEWKGITVLRSAGNECCIRSFFHQGAVSIRKTVLPGMAIPMLKIRRPNGRLIFNMEITIRR